MSRADEVRFDALLRDAIDQVIPLGYTPTRFIGMLNSKGAFRTVTDIVQKGHQSDGFNELVLLGKTSLTCEAIIVETEWRRFFASDLLLIAERRLTLNGYAWSRFEAAENGVGETVDEFDPGIPDHRERELRERAVRQGQAQFRSALEAAYGAKCCVTGTTVSEALQAAHLAAYRGEQFNHVANGLLLRADLHVLFDRYLLSIDPESLQIRLAPQVRDDVVYRDLEGRALLVPLDVGIPSRRALNVHWSTFNEGQR